jgi:hypothetical protein
MTDRTADSSQLVYARIAGVAYILIIVIGVLSGTLIDSKLIVPGDDGLTARNIMDNELLFRIGIIGALVMYAGVLLLSAALYVVLEKVNRNLALLAMLLRSGEAIVGVAMVLLSFVVLFLLNGEGRSTAFDTPQLHALAGVFLDVRAGGLDLVLVLVGLGGTVFCYSFFVSRYVPRALAAWGIFTYLSILVLAFVSILMPTLPVILETVLYALGGAFELVFGFWLVFKGVDLHAGLGAPAS